VAPVLRKITVKSKNEQEGNAKAKTTDRQVHPQDTWLQFYEKLKKEGVFQEKTMNVVKKWTQKQSMR
jgi:hypothetical protein